MHIRGVLLAALFVAGFSAVATAQDEQQARGIVVKALVQPNNLNVRGGELQTKANPKGQGLFVFDPRTRFSGVERYLIWLVVKGEAYPLNGPSKTLTPEASAYRYDGALRLGRRAGHHRGAVAPPPQDRLPATRKVRKGKRKRR